MNQLVEQITRLYDRDQSSGELARTVDDIPVSYEAVTDEWLSAILQRDFPGAVVSGHRLDDTDNGSSNRRRIFLEYDDRGIEGDAPDTVFCKGSQNLLNRIMFGICGTAHGEVTFYNRIRPGLSLEAPVCHHAAYDPQSFNSIIVMKDMTGAVTFCDHRTPVDFDAASAMLAVLAALHGSHYEDPALVGDDLRFLRWPDHFGNADGAGMQQGSNQGFLDGKEVIPARLYERYDEIWPATVRSTERHRTLPTMLLHSDVHLKNWYRRHDGTMGLSDWQCVSVGHWSRDVAYMMSTALKVEDRRAWERDLLKVYLDKLAAAGGEATPFDLAWDLYRQQLLSALAYWTVTLVPGEGMPDMQPRDVTIEFIRRIATAIDDLDGLDANP